MVRDGRYSRSWDSTSSFSLDVSRSEVVPRGSASFCGDGRLCNSSMAYLAHVAYALDSVRSASGSLACRAKGWLTCCRAKATSCGFAAGKSWLEPMLYLAIGRASVQTCPTPRECQFACILACAQQANFGSCLWLNTRPSNTV